MITVSGVSDCLTQTCQTDGLHAYTFTTAAANKPENAAGTIISIPNRGFVTRLALVFYSAGGGHLYISFYSPGVSYGSWTKVI